MEALKYVESSGLGAVRTALSKIARDKTGKEALVNSVRKIVLVNVAEAFAKTVTLSDGTLTLKCAWDKSFEGWYSENDLTKAIEKLL